MGWRLGSDLAPGVEYVMAPGGDHSIHRNQYEAFRAVLVGWLEPVSPG